MPAGAINHSLLEDLIILKWLFVCLSHKSLVIKETI